MTLLQLLQKHLTSWPAGCGTATATQNHLGVIWFVARNGYALHNIRAELASDYKDASVNKQQFEDAKNDQ